MEEWTNRVTSKIKNKYFWYEPEKNVLDYLNKFENVLEIGCGMGRYEKLDQKIIGLEYSKKFISYCCTNIDGVFLRADGFNIPIEDNTFDCVFSSGVIEHFDDSIIMVKEHVRVCKPGGIVIITVPAQGTPDNYLFKLWLKLLASEEEKDFHYHGRRMSDNEVYNILQEVGLREISTVHFGEPIRGSINGAKIYMNLFKQKPSIEPLVGTILNILGFFFLKLMKIKWSRYILNKLVNNKGYYLFASGRKAGNTLHKKSSIRKYEELYIKLICPICKEKTTIQNNSIVCELCNVKFPVINKVPFLTISDAESLDDSNVINIKMDNGSHDKN